MSPLLEKKENNAQPTKKNKTLVNRDTSQKNLNKNQILEPINPLDNSYEDAPTQQQDPPKVELPTQPTNRSS